jgi:hypothetical protein
MMDQDLTFMDGHHLQNLPVAELNRIKLTPSERSVLLATAGNEGNRDANNTWDRNFLSFGMFSGRADNQMKMASSRHS